jgi:hypothetical protein
MHGLCTVYAKTLLLVITQSRKKDGYNQFQMNVAANRQLSFKGLCKTFLAIKAGDLFVPPMKIT